VVIFEPVVHPPHAIHTKSLHNPSQKEAFLGETRKVSGCFGFLILPHHIYLPLTLWYSRYDEFLITIIVASPDSTKSSDFPPRPTTSPHYACKQSALKYERSGGRRSPSDTTPTRVMSKKTTMTIATNQIFDHATHSTTKKRMPFKISAVGLGARQSS
jgi:hypothetical protein